MFILNKYYYSILLLRLLLFLLRHLPISISTSILIYLNLNKLESIVCFAYYVCAKVKIIFGTKHVREWVGVAYRDNITLRVTSYEVQTHSDHMECHHQ